MGEILGTGKFSIVREAVNQKSGQRVAVKEIDKRKLSIKDMELLAEEISILKTLTH
jgi:serine/threonine protein kinase